MINQYQLNYDKNQYSHAGEVSMLSDLSIVIESIEIWYFVRWFALLKAVFLEAVFDCHSNNLLYVDFSELAAQTIKFI